MKKALCSLLLLSLFLILSSPLHAEVEETYVRLDADNTGFYTWIGGNSRWGKVKLSHDIIYYPGTNAFQFEIGPYFSLGEGKLDILPMVSLFTNDLGSGKIDYFLPELFLYSTLGNWYLEGWNSLYLGLTKEGKELPYFYGRYFALYKVTSWVSLGPQVELTLDMADEAEKTLSSLQLGGALSFPYGKGNTILLFLGAETKGDTSFACRVSFTHYF